MGDLLRKTGRWLLASPTRRRGYDAVGDLIQSHVHTVVIGPGRGLAFSGGSNPGYVLGLGERAVQKALVAHLRPGGVFWDVGANAGFMSVLANRLVGPTGSVHCFEPVAENVKVLERNLEANNANKHIHQIALADEDGVAQMTVRRGITARLADDGVPVTIARGDSLDAPTPTVVTIDVAGAECRVLEGMSGLLDSHKPVVIVEIHNGTGPQVRAQLNARGYAVQTLSRCGGMSHLVAVPAKP